MAKRKKIKVSDMRIAMLDRIKLKNRGIPGPKNANYELEKQQDLDVFSYYSPTLRPQH